MSDVARKSGLSIGWKISIPVLLGMAIAILTVELIITNQNVEFGETEIEQQARAVTQLAAGNAGGAVKFRKADNLKAQFEGILSSLPHSVKQIAAFDAEGNLIAILPDGASPNSGVLQAAETSRGNGEISWNSDETTSAAPVVFGPKAAVVGTLAFQWDNSLMIERLRTNTDIAAVIGLIVAIVVAGALSFGLWRIVVMPLRNLSARIGDLASGHLAEIPYTGRRDEVGMMARSMEAIHQNALEGERLKTSLLNASSAISITDNAGDIIFANAAFQKLASVLKPELGSAIVGHSLSEFDPAPAERLKSLEALKTGQQDMVTFNAHRLERSTTPIFDIEGARIGIVSEWQDRTEADQMSSMITEVAEAAAAGDFGRRIDISGSASDQRSGELAECVNRICEASGAFLTDLDQALNRLADGDLTQGVSGRYQGGFGSVAQSLETTLGTLAPLIQEVKNAGAELGITIEGVRNSSSTLANGAMEQAGALEETNATMNQLAEAGDTSATLANSAQETATDASDRAETGGATVSQTVAAMREIESRSAEITDITGVIETIAFQTNLLALNASVEAARAGDHGKGFAVVANEVRSLAERASTAASDIKSLIEQNHGSVVEGGKLVDSTGETFNEIVEAIRGLADKVGAIAKSSGEQKLSLKEISSVIESLDSATQNNSRIATESADSATKLAELSDRLSTAVNRFKMPASAQSRRSAA